MDFETLGSTIEAREHSSGAATSFLGPMQIQCPTGEETIVRTP